MTLLDVSGTGIIHPGHNVSEFDPKVEPKSWLLGGGLLYEEELFSSLIVLVTLLDVLGTGIIHPGHNVSEFGPKVEQKSWLLGVSSV